MATILHFSDSLPDHRVEKYAIYYKKLGHKIHFVGYENKEANYSFEQTRFDSINKIFIEPKFRFFPKFMKSKIDIKSYFREIDPDIIHVHNIFSLNIISKILPEYLDRVVYDSHEFWSKQAKLRHNFRLNSNLLYRYLIPYWEKLIGSVPTITVSEQIAKEFSRKYNNSIITIPNLPLLELIPKKKTDRIENTIAYIGNLDNNSKIYNYRNNRPLIENINEYKNFKLHIYGNNKNKIKLKNLSYKGFMRHQDLIPELKSQIYGLYGFQAHPFHYYTSPVRISNFIHSGLIPIIPKSMSEGLFKDFKSKVIIYDDIKNVPEILKNYNSSYDENIHQEIIEIAQNKFHLAIYLDKLTELYDKIIEI